MIEGMMIEGKMVEGMMVENENFLTGFMWSHSAQQTQHVRRQCGFARGCHFSLVTSDWLLGFVCCCSPFFVATGGTCQRGGVVLVVMAAGSTMYRADRILYHLPGDFWCLSICPQRLPMVWLVSLMQMMFVSHLGSGLVSVLAAGSCFISAKYEVVVVVF